ncbi:Plasmodium exported protein, unknown function [Plasmodium gonderi]|uniref:Uncharacterized protein n=1 Tax=Plasmodium gonderi TaxID=77519 RepID=A0A1Y1JPS0_PLAGO|nr:Plasmodium exported protein, unknown function [Plasmodium gonderi]GAW83227.1 Plasmodium exported protein, unknown function [Plasmodium gonderi]
MYRILFCIKIFLFTLFIWIFRAASNYEVSCYDLKVKAKNAQNDAQLRTSRLLSSSELDVEIEEEINDNVVDSQEIASSSSSSCSLGRSSEEFVRESSRDISQEIRRDLDRESSRDISQEIRRDLDRESSRDISQEIRRDLDRENSRDISQEIRRDLDRESSRDIDRDRSRDLDRDIESFKKYIADVATSDKPFKEKMDDTKAYIKNMDPKVRKKIKQEIRDKVNESELSRRRSKSPKICRKCKGMIDKLYYDDYKMMVKMKKMEKRTSALIFGTGVLSGLLAFLLIPFELITCSGTLFALAFVLLIFLLKKI